MHEHDSNSISFENKIIIETNDCCQLCNLIHTVEHSGRILGCVDNYQIKKATTIETWHQEAMALLPTWWRLALEKKRCHFSCCQHLLGTQLWRALLLYRIHKRARKRLKAGLIFFEFYGTFPNLSRKYDFLFFTMYDNKMLYFNKVSQFYNISATGKTWK